jgi:hypothetical protein
MPAGPEQAYHELSALSEVVARLLNVDREWGTQKLKQVT